MSKSKSYTLTNKNYRLIAQLLAVYGVRNTDLEDLHIGITPTSKTGDHSDVYVVSPYGKIPWKKLSRISDEEMRSLMLNIEVSLAGALRALLEFDEDHLKVLPDIVAGGRTYDHPVVGEYLRSKKKHP